MCGISGVYNYNGKPVDEVLLKKMTAVLAHRGPDDNGIFVKNHIGLGHRRLSIIDVSAAGHQPMANKDGSLQIVFNGEIYNFQEIRKMLQAHGHTFKSKTDTEVILHAYEHWGFDCATKFNGMFAFAIFDAKQDLLFLARDRMGEKPLYYFADNNRFMFASEIKAILQDAVVPRKISSQGMLNYFTFGHSIAPGTMYEGIKKLPPAHYMIVKNGEIGLQQYWDSFIASNPVDRGEQYYKQATRDLLESSVNDRLIADVPLGVFLSGGLDSAAVVAMMQKQVSAPIKTFSVGFDMEDGEFNELSRARIIANHFKTDHHELVLKENDLVDAVEKLVYHFDEPFGDAAAFPIYFLSKFAKEKVSVVLTGDGGDELFGGYRRYVVEKNLGRLGMLSMVAKNPVTRSAVNALPHLRRTKKLVNSLAVKDQLQRYASWISFFSPDMQQQLFAQLPEGDALAAYKYHLAKTGSTDWFGAIMYLDQKILLPDGYLEKVDKPSMAFGLETRAPFLDYRLVEFANAMPADYKIRGKQTKYLFRKAMEGILPPEIVHHKKQGFAVPTNQWFRGALKNYLAEVLFDQKTKERGYFNYAAIETWYKMYQDKKQPLDSQFWLLLNFELWHRKFID